MKRCPQCGVRPEETPDVIGFTIFCPSCLWSGIGVVSVCCLVDDDDGSLARDFARAAWNGLHLNPKTH